MLTLACNSGTVSLYRLVLKSNNSFFKCKIGICFKQKMISSIKIKVYQIFTTQLSRYLQRPLKNPYRSSTKYYHVKYLHANMSKHNHRGEPCKHIQYTSVKSHPGYLIQSSDGWAKHGELFAKLKGNGEKNKISVQHRFLVFHGNAFSENRSDTVQILWLWSGMFYNVTLQVTTSALLIAAVILARVYSYVLTASLQDRKYANLFLL